MISRMTAVLSCFFVEHGNRRMGVPYEAYRYNQFYDGRYIISGLTTAEMLLNKAEHKFAKECGKRV